MQTRKGSFYESIFNIGTGFLLSYGASFIILPLFGYEPPQGKSGITYFYITGCYTIVSLFRTFVIRRLFNKMVTRKHTMNAIMYDNEYTEEEKQIRESFKNIKP